jgi:hypothetical protein
MATLAVPADQPYGRDEKTGLQVIGQGSQLDSEGLIPVSPPDSRVFYIVDCSFLHLVEGSTLFTNKSYPGADVSS